MDAHAFASNPSPGSPSLADAMAALRAELLAAEAELADVLAAVPAATRASAVNLVHYLALRRQDRRVLQDRLADAGLSSLGRCEGAVLHGVEAVLARLGRAEPTASQRVLSRGEGRALLERRAEALLGAPPRARRARILVTLPAEAARDPGLVERLVAGGMDAVRLNCAHDDAATWRAMAANVRRAARAAGRTCPILMDLGGPKLRTGAIGAPGQRVKWRPRRDELGRVVEAAPVWLVPEGRDDQGERGPTLAVAAEWLARRRPGERIELTDVRGKRRTLRVGAGTEGATACTSEDTTYLVAGDVVPLRVDGDTPTPARIVAPPPGQRRLSLERGERFVLTRSAEPGRPGQRLDEAHVLPPRLPCTLPEIFGAVRVGERVFVDDGKLAGVIEASTPDEVHVRLTGSTGAIAHLGADKGINLPDSSLAVPALTRDDLVDLDAVVEEADIVGLSFVRRPEDVAELRRELERRGGTGLGIVLKIETRAAFDALPALLLAALAGAGADGQPARVGVMIARGDLAIECGYERLAELQEEILWLCEAAHVPVIWATQVLDTLARHGEPSRAEITDAAMGERAECVMLNKGAFVERAVEVLGDILTRMGEHQDKKMAMLRSLRVSSGPFAPAATPPEGTLVAG